MQKLATSKWLKVCLFVFVVTLPLFLGGCGTGSTAPLNISGTWFVYNATNGTPPSGPQGPDNFVLSQDTNGNLTGTALQGLALTGGSVSGLNISFTFTETINNAPVSYTYSGTIGITSTDGTTMHGTWSNSSSESGIWSAVFDNVNTAVANIPTSWTISNGTPTTTGETGPYTFIQSGTLITGGTTPGGQTDITGTVDSEGSQNAPVGSSIIFCYIDSAGSIYIYTGIISSGTAMSGIWVSTNGETDTWTATAS